MIKPDRLSLMIAMALGLIFTADQAWADPWVEMTGCEPVAVGGQQLWHVQFALTNAGGTAVYSVAMKSPDPNAPRDSCHTVTLDDPAGWHSFRRPDGGGQWSTPFGFDTEISVGETLGGFGATVSGAGCCFFIILFNAFGDSVGSSHYCFHCDPSAATTRTWGYVKFSYR